MGLLVRITEKFHNCPMINSVFMKLNMAVKSAVRQAASEHFSWLGTGV